MAFDLEFSPIRRDPRPLDFSGPTKKPGGRTKSARHEEEEALATLEGWYQDQVDAHAENRREQLLDCNYYDHEQLDERTRRVLEARNQAPLQFDMTHAVIDWIAGTERRTRVDWKVFPRGPEDTDAANVKTQLLKYITDAGQISWERSQAFKDAVKCGVGWMREFAQMDHDDVPVTVQRVDWKCVRWDEFSRADDLRDCRSMNIDRFVDLDYAIGMFPRLASSLREASSHCIDSGYEYLQDDWTVPSLFHGRQSTTGGVYSASNRRGGRQRARVHLVETEYRRVVTEKRVRALTSDYAELSGISWDDTDGELADLQNRKIITVDDRPVERMWVAIWVPGTKIMCLHEQRPYRHDKFSLTPVWCYRRDRDGLPYGVIRGIRDPQDEYNKRRSKALFAASVNRVLYEEDAIANGVDEEDFLDEVAKPNGQIKLAAGAMAKGAVKIESGLQVAEGHIRLMEQSERHIFQASGVTRENLGLDSSSQSGRAILAKQQQGAVTTAELFDNYRRAIQTSGEKTLSLAEQYIGFPMFVRVLGQQGAEFIGINQPVFDPISGRVVFENDIQQSKADFVVDQQDYRETTRMAMAEMLMESISKMPPELGIQLLDLAVDLTDLPNRQEITQRIRSITGVGQPADPAQQQAQQQAQQAAQALEQQAAQVRIKKESAQADKLKEEANRIRVQTKGEALNVVAGLEQGIHRAPAADRLAEYPPPLGDGFGAGMEVAQ
jgi:hypothetical protein